MQNLLPAQRQALGDFLQASNEVVLLTVQEGLFATGLIWEFAA